MPAGDGAYHPAPTGLVQLLLAVINAEGVQRRVIIQSSDPRPLEPVHRQQPRPRTALLVDNPDGLAENLRRLSLCLGIDSPRYNGGFDVGALLPQRRMLVIPWTANTIGEAERLL